MAATSRLSSIYLLLVLNALKVSFLFIGAIIGAGFASGREIALYFSAANTATVLLAALLIGAFCCFFLLLGKLDNQNGGAAPYPAKQKGGFAAHLRYAKRGVNFLVILSSAVTFIAMCAGAETLFRQAFGVPYIGLISGLMAAVMSVFSMNALKSASLFLVPLILLTCLILFVSGMPFTSSAAHNFDPYNALNYTAMNMMLGGFLIRNQGAKMRGKHIVLTGVITAATLAAALFMMYAIVSVYPEAELPLFDYALAQNLSSAAAVIIFLAIFTTQLSAAKIIAAAAARQRVNDLACVIFLAALAALTFKYSFKGIVDATYPIVGAIGLAFLALALLEPLTVPPNRQRKRLTLS